MCVCVCVCVCLVSPEDNASYTQVPTIVGSEFKPRPDPARRSITIGLKRLTVHFRSDIVNIELL